MLKKYSEILPIEIIEHKINRGLGETSRDLFERAAEITFEGDIIVDLIVMTHMNPNIYHNSKKVRSG